MSNGFPSPQGLYDPRNEHDGCGVGFIADLKGRKSHKIVRDGLTALVNLDHRGACGCENNTGDGAGFLIEIPHDFLVDRCRPLGIAFPEPQALRRGRLVRLSRSGSTSLRPATLRARSSLEEGLTILGWLTAQDRQLRLVLGSKSVEPAMFHGFVGSTDDDDADRFERKLYVIRKRFESAIASSGLDDHKYFYFSSLSCRTLVYKGMLTPNQLGAYFADDLDDPAIESALSMFHSRFSTNTFPSWELAHPYRMISHNGEINTLRGNINWMRARAPFD